MVHTSLINEANMSDSGLSFAHTPIRIDLLQAARLSGAALLQNRLTACHQDTAAFHRTIAVALLGAVSWAGALMRIDTFQEVFTLLSSQGSIMVYVSSLKVRESPGPNR